MPKKLTDCVKDVKAQGKSEDSAYAICVDSTGLSPHHENKEVEKAWKEYAKSEHSGIPELDSPIHRENKKPAEMENQVAAPEVLPNMRTQPNREPAQPKVAPGHHPTMQAVEEEEQFKRDFEDRDIMDEQHKSDYAIDQEAREELRSDGEHEFWDEVHEKKKTLPPEQFAAWVKDTVSPEYVEKVMNATWEDDLSKAWDTFEKEWKPYKEWIKEKEEGRNAPKKAKVDKKDKPWKKKDKK
jgi:hypothetical protein